jgi:hypothetical protein
VPILPVSIEDGKEVRSVTATKALERYVGVLIVFLWNGIIFPRN